MTKDETIVKYGCELRIYDNGGRSMDRFTILAPRYAGRDWRWNDRDWTALFSGEEPRGMSGHGPAQAGAHLGKRIAWSELPAQVRSLVRVTDFAAFAPA